MNGVVARNSLLARAGDRVGDLGIARKAGVEYAGAVCYVLDGGDRREAILRDDAGSASLFGTPGEVCQRTGSRVHAYVLMSKHYRSIPAGNSQSQIRLRWVWLLCARCGARI